MCVEQEYRRPSFFFFLLANKENEKRTIIVRMKSDGYDDETKIDLFFNRRRTHAKDVAGQLFIGDGKSSRIIDYYDDVCTSAVFNNRISQNVNLF